MGGRRAAALELTAVLVLELILSAAAAPSGPVMFPDRRSSRRSLSFEPAPTRDAVAARSSPRLGDPDPAGPSSAIFFGGPAAGPAPDQEPAERAALATEQATPAAEIGPEEASGFGVEMTDGIETAELNPVEETRAEMLPSASPPVGESSRLTLAPFPSFPAFPTVSTPRFPSFTFPSGGGGGSGTSSGIHHPSPGGGGGGSVISDSGSGGSGGSVISDSGMGGSGGSVISDSGSGGSGSGSGVISDSGSGGSGSGISSGLVFPDHRVSPLEPDGGEAFVPECDGVPYKARNPETGRCQYLMLQTDCADGEWFVLDAETNEPSCRPRPCPAHHVLHEGACRHRDTPGLCPAGMDVLVNEYGEAGCDCELRQIYWPAHDRCYPAYRQGPCIVGQFLVSDEAGTRCANNVCVRDGAVFWAQTRRCHELASLRDSPCEHGRLDVNEETMQLECVETQLNAVFDLPVVRCSKGSKLDYKGRCKRELYQRFRASFSVRAVGSERQCQEGFIRAPSGRCLKKSPGSLG